jgi:hypothetical protein
MVLFDNIAMIHSYLNSIELTFFMIYRAEWYYEIFFSRGAKKKKKKKKKVPEN